MDEAGKDPVDKNFSLKYRYSVLNPDTDRFGSILVGWIWNDGGQILATKVEKRGEFSCLKCRMFSFEG
jgi:hypothetical protein